MSALHVQYENQAQAGAEAQMQRQDRAIRQYTLAHDQLKTLLVESVKSGNDIKLPRPGDRFSTLFATSTYLAESVSPEARDLLFRACGAAVRGENASGMLEAFVECVARDYADDYADEMVEGGGL
ncbi:hypothetical protein C1M51_02905 [Methylibium sp. Pch-M]|uniref:hypothetical protein n=1 Tax=Methylibium sp. Pch-M TaxID=2082386 RepID=UPI0010119B32|nr:hypothetical protein [Methylibium sp. Pch-M]QAZ38454.1 hypothetical protein C1M51_02905 [Methylibium sp. Pch-M]